MLFHLAPLFKRRIYLPVAQKKIPEISGLRRRKTEEKAGGIENTTRGQMR